MSTLAPGTVIARLYLPIEMGTVAKVLQAIADEYPEANLARSDDPTVVVLAMPGERVTHGRHCRCSSCAREDWTNPDFAPCSMHGPTCPPVYSPSPT